MHRRGTNRAALEGILAGRWSMELVSVARSQPCTNCDMLSRKLFVAPPPKGRTGDRWCEFCFMQLARRAPAQVDGLEPRKRASGRLRIY